MENSELRKTALQELIEWAKIGLTHSEPKYVAAMENLLQKIEGELLEKEKEQIKDAFEKGVKDWCNYDPERHGNEGPTGIKYFTQTFQQ